jgi:flavin-dependent thymidylate synthase
MHPNERNKAFLINYTGIGHSAGAYRFAAAVLIHAKETRLEQSASAFFDILETMPWPQMEKKLEYIANTIRSSWEFVDYTFQLSGLAVSTGRQVTRTRHASFAEKSQRITNMSDADWIEPDGIAAFGDMVREGFDKSIQVALANYQNLINAGVAAQDAREVLPMAIETRMVAKYDLRTLADLVAKRNNIRATGAYSDLVASMEQQVLAVHPWTSMFLRPERTKTPNLDNLLREALKGRAITEAPEIAAAAKELDMLKGTWG